MVLKAQFSASLDHMNFFLAWFSFFLMNKILFLLYVARNLNLYFLQFTVAEINNKTLV